MIPLHLITGFLGSGKTTFLVDVARRFPGRRLLFLINDFSQNSTDFTLLKTFDLEVIPIFGGSIFCRCLLTDFLNHLQEIALRFPGPDPPLDAVIVEASGISDPRSAERLLRESKMEQHFTLSSIVCLVDPGSFRKLLPILPNITAQVQSADLVLINKTDLYSEADLGEAECRILEIRPLGSILRICRGVSAWNPFENAHRKELWGEYTTCRDPHFSVVNLPTPEALSIAGLQSDITGFAEDIYRIKGYLREAQKTFAVDYSFSHWTWREVPGEILQPSLVLIYNPRAEDRIRRMRRLWEQEKIQP